MRAHPFPLVKTADPDSVEDTPELLPCGGCSKPTCYALVACADPERMELRKFEPDHTGGLAPYLLKRAGVRCGPWIGQNVGIGGTHALHACPTPLDDRSRAILSGAHDWSDCEGTP
jgi:hypothetical protein